MAREPINQAPSDSVSADDKAAPLELEKYDTVGELIQIDPVVEASVTRKFDKYILPWLFGLWLLAFIDRSNIGNARINGLAKDLDLGTGPKFNIALTIFYVPYILVDVPSNWLVKRVGAGFYLPALILGWGVVSLCIGFVKSYETLLAVRFFLGIMEGGLLGSMIIYLAMFYRRHQLIKRIGLFYCAAPLSSAIGGLLATGLSQITAPGYTASLLSFSSKEPSLSSSAPSPSSSYPTPQAIRNSSPKMTSTPQHTA
jgi:MFS family permease